MKIKTAQNLTSWGTTIAVIGALAVILSGYGYQWGWWHFSFGFSMIPYGTAGAVVGGILALIGFLKLKDRTGKMKIAGITSIIIVVAALGNIGYWYMEVQKGYPPIHDITTDIENPPEFVAIAPLRAEAPNPVGYAGAETAEAQKNYYGDLQPIITAYDYDEAYDRALKTARNMGWSLVAENKEEGRIEAYEKLAWYGFIDDVVIRVDTTETGSQIDIRSKSRIGRGDLGVNAKRIKAYKQEFEN